MREVQAGQADGVLDRHKVFARFLVFARPETCRLIPDPQAPESRERSALDWSWAGEARHQERVAFHRSLLGDLRAREIAPLMAGLCTLRSASRLGNGLGDRLDLLECTCYGVWW